MSDRVVADGLRWSHVTGPATTPLVLDSIGCHFDLTSRRWEARTAIIACHQRCRASYGQLRNEVNRLAAGLLKGGLQPGDRIAIWSRNGYEWVLTELAAARAGLVLVALNPAYRAAELHYALDTVGCRAIVLSGREENESFLAILGELAPEIHCNQPGRLAAKRLPHLRLVCVFGEARCAAALRLADLILVAGRRDIAALNAMDVQARAPAAILFTSGTTALPKAATLSHANILNNGFFIGETLGLREDDRVCLPVQLYHSYGMVAGVLSALTHGAAVVLPDERFAAASALRAIERERCTAVLGTPTMFAAMLDHLDRERFELTSLRTGIVSCSPCPSDVLRGAITRMNLRDLTVAYGMTETSPVSFQTAINAPLERRLKTVGRIHPHLEAKVVDAEGRTLAAGRAGELLVRGYSVMLGYWGDRRATQEAIDVDGWLRTGDIAIIDEEGYCRLVGRAKEIILRGGETVAPVEVEALLQEHPSVGEACVFGVPDRRFGEEIAAWVRLRDGAAVTAAELRAFCRARAANVKVPRYIRFVEAFPRTATGKAMRIAMREITITERGLADHREPGGVDQ